MSCVNNRGVLFFAIGSADVANYCVFYCQCTDVGFLTKYLFRENFTRLVAKRFSLFSEYKGEFRELHEAVKVTNEMSFAKHKIRENRENVKILKMDETESWREKETDRQYT